jgi:small subunit ribosomal protein S15
MEITMSITKEKKQELITSHATGKADTGSVEVQCAILTERIKNLTGHANGNRKDHQARRGLLVLVHRRKRLMNYLKSKDQARHQELVRALGLRK